MFGVAVSSSSPAVAARCAHARAGVGAVASQNVTDPRLGPRTLDLMGLGATAPEAVAVIARTAPHAEFRQVLAIDGQGRTGIHSGRRTLGRHAEARRDDAAAAGNLLANEGVPAAMLEAFEDTRGHLGDRILAAMQAALDAGGEEGPVHSAGMMLVREVPWPVAELRCDWTEECPVAAIARAWEVYRPQLDDYVTRALDPTRAPSYGVPGDR
jgi:uncharacterized Ntn-hydrolase superfamily protein